MHFALVPNYFSSVLMVVCLVIKKWRDKKAARAISRLLQFNQSKSARNVNFIMFIALFTCFYIVYMDVYML